MKCVFSTILRGACVLIGRGLGWLIGPRRPLAGSLVVLVRCCHALQANEASHIGISGSLGAPPES